MLLFFSVIGLVLSIIVVIAFSEVKLIIENYELSNLNKNIIQSYKGKIGIYFLGKVKLFSISIDNDKLSKLSEKNLIKDRLKRIKEDSSIVESRKKQLNWELIKRCKKQIKINSLKLKISIDTEDVVLTSYIVAIISIIVPNLLRNNIRNIKQNDYEFAVLPIYNNQNYIHLKLNSIISIKIVHIINMFSVIGGIKNERTSNRWFNANCYGKY